MCCYGRQIVDTELSLWRLTENESMTLTREAANLAVNAILASNETHGNTQWHLALQRCLVNSNHSFRMRILFILLHVHTIDIYCIVEHLPTAAVGTSPICILNLPLNVSGGVL